MKGVILAGGQGTRLRPLTLVANKHLLPLYNKPMILYPIETLKSLDITDILIVTGGEHIGRFADFLQDGSAFGVKLTYKVQNQPDGIAGALALAEEFIGDDESFAVILGDNIFDNKSIKSKISSLELHANKAILFTKAITDPSRFGVIKYENDKPIEIIEKPKEFISHNAVVGLYCYPRSVFSVIGTLEKSAREEYEITDINNHFLKRGECVVLDLDGFWSDAGTFDSLLKASNWVASYE